jgi:hypothetical protein
VNRGGGGEGHGQRGRSGGEEGDNGASGDVQWWGVTATSDGELVPAVLPYIELGLGVVGGQCP